MAIDDLPSIVVNFLNIIGIEWPYINEDSLHSFATIVREFSQAVEQTHEDATQTVAAAAQAYQGAATETMHSGWAQLSATHVKELTAACSVAADALDAWAVYVVAQKVEALGQLAELAAGYFAAIAAGPETLGASLSALPGLEELGQQLGKALKQTLEQYVIGEVISAACKPLEQKIANLLSGLDWSNAPGGVDPLSSSTAGFQIEPEAAYRHAADLQAHSETMRQHAQDVSAKIAALEF